MNAAQAAFLKGVAHASEMGAEEVTDHAKECETCKQILTSLGEVADEQYWWDTPIKRAERLVGKPYVPGLFSKYSEREEKL